MAMWFEETYDDQLRFSLRVTEYVYRAKSKYQSIDIFDTETFGRALALDNVYQTSVEDEFHYHEMLVHPALTTAPNLARVLVIGGGDGGTVREVLRYPGVERVTMVELDEMVVQACKEHLTQFKVPWDDPRLELRFEDGVKYLQDSTERFDVILVDGPDPVGPAAGLYQSPFYRACADRLQEHGVLAAQVEAPLLMKDDFARIIRTLRGVFPRAQPYFGPVPIYVSGSWAYGYAARHADPAALIEERVAQIAPGCRHWNRDVHMAAFAQSTQIKQMLADPG